MSSVTTKLGSEKLQQIRDAALEAFLLYGFKRTSMEDIAAVAGMSRAALYLHFKNKRDIFRSMIDGLYQQAHARFEAELDPTTPVAETLRAALEAKDGGVMAQVLASPHGAEIIGLGHDTSADLIAQHEAVTTQILERYFRAVLADRGILPSTPPDRLARHIIETVIALHKTPDTDGQRLVLIGRTGAALLGTD